MTKRGCASPISKVESHMLDTCRCSPYTRIASRGASTGYPSWKVVEELQRAVAANPEEVAVGTDPNID